MSKPQSPELRRTGRNPALDPDNAATRIEAAPRPTTGGPEGPVPPGNQPGHRSASEQDQPDPDAFVERFNSGPVGPGSDEAADEASDAPVGPGGPGGGRSTRLVQLATTRIPAARRSVGHGVVQSRRSMARVLRRIAGAVEPS